MSEEGSPPPVPPPQPVPEPEISIADLVAATNAASRHVRKQKELAAKYRQCTFPRGPVRQVVFICATCNPAIHGGRVVDESDMSGFCRACSLHCHPDHEVITLGYRWHFRCDCGTPRHKAKDPTGGNCVLTPKPQVNNEGNKYTHSFSNRFCTCNAVDDAETVEDQTMYQCAVCDDWFHEKHLGVPHPEGFADFVCVLCAEKMPFLRRLPTTMVGGKAQGPAPVPAAPGQCIMLPAPATSAGPVFLSTDLVASLCPCPSCKATLANLSLGYLGRDEVIPDEEDEEEDVEIDEAAIQAREEEDALKQLDHAQQCDLSFGFAEFSSAVRGHLRTLAESNPGHIVTKEDIHGFVEAWKQSRKRPLPQ